MIFSITIAEQPMRFANHMFRKVTAYYPPTSLLDPAMSKNSICGKHACSQTSGLGELRQFNDVDFRSAVHLLAAMTPDVCDQQLRATSGHSLWLRTMGLCTSPGRFAGPDHGWTVALYMNPVFVAHFEEVAKYPNKPSLIKGGPFWLIPAENRP